MVLLRLTLRIDLPNGSRLGPGKIALLEAVHARRSIAAAARDYEMSYRRAWLLIDELNHAFDQPVVETFPGRSQGAGAALTSFGEKIVTLYRQAEQQSHAASNETLADIARHCTKSLPAETVNRPPRRPSARGA